MRKNKVLEYKPITEKYLITFNDYKKVLLDLGCKRFTLTVYHTDTFPKPLLIEVDEFIDYRNIMEMEEKSTLILKLNFESIKWWKNRIKKTKFIEKDGKKWKN